MLFHSVFLCVPACVKTGIVVNVTVGFGLKKYVYPSQFYFASFFFGEFISDEVRITVVLFLIHLCGWQF